MSQTVLRAGVSAIFGSVDTELLLKEETGIVQVRKFFFFYSTSDLLYTICFGLEVGSGQVWTSIHPARFITVARATSQLDIWRW